MTAKTGGYIGPLHEGAPTLLALPDINCRGGESPSTSTTSSLFLDAANTLFTHCVSANSGNTGDDPVISCTLRMISYIVGLPRLDVVYVDSDVTASASLPEPIFLFVRSGTNSLGIAGPSFAVDPLAVEHLAFDASRMGTECASERYCALASYVDRRPHATSSSSASASAAAWDDIVLNEGVSMLGTSSGSEDRNRSRIRFFGDKNKVFVYCWTLAQHVACHYWSWLERGTFDYTSHSFETLANAVRSPFYFGNYLLVGGSQRKHHHHQQQQQQHDYDVEKDDDDDEDDDDDRDGVRRKRRADDRRSQSNQTRILV